MNILSQILGIVSGERIFCEFFFRGWEGSRLINGFLSWIAVHFFPFPTHNIFGWITYWKKRKFHLENVSWRTLSFKKHIGLHDVAPAQLLITLQHIVCVQSPDEMHKSVWRIIKLEGGKQRCNLWRSHNSRCVCFSSFGSLQLCVCAKSWVPWGENKRFEIKYLARVVIIDLSGGKEKKRARTRRLSNSISEIQHGTRFMRDFRRVSSLFSLPCWPPLARFCVFSIQPRKATELCVGNKKSIKCVRKRENYFHFHYFTLHQAWHTLSILAVKRWWRKKEITQKAFWVVLGWTSERDFSRRTFDALRAACFPPFFLSTHNSNVFKFFIEMRLHDWLQDELQPAVK